MARTVNAERARRYLARTLTRPEGSYTLTEEEALEQMDYQDAWLRNQAAGRRVPPVVDWMNRINRFCEVRRLGRPTFTIQENYRQYGTKTVRWYLDDRPRSIHV